MSSTKTISLIFTTLLAVALSACGGKTEQPDTNPDKQAAIAEVQTAVAESREIPTYFEATGTLAGDEQTDVAPAIGGKIAEVNFDIGSFVKKGDVLVRLDSRDAQIRLDTAKKSYEQAVAALRQAQIRLNVKDGETFDIEKFSQVRSTKAQLELAEKELARAQKLVESGDVPRAVLDQRKSQRDALLGQLDEARANAAVATKAIDTARAAVNTAETQIAAAEKTLSDMTVVAPISGYVAERNADVGEFISPNVPNAKIATIVRTAVLRLKIDVPEQSIARVSKGQNVVVQVTAYPERNFNGRIVRVAPSLNPASRALNVEAEVENGEGLLKPGQFATVRITQSKPAPVVMIPASAVRSDGTSNSVFVIKDGIAGQRMVQLGLLEGDMIEIKQGVATGETVAVGNIGALGDGMPVRTGN